jgi:predicted nucleotidyltransferase
LDLTTAYPGTPRHQALLKAVVAHYADDPRVLAVSLFGSLARGSWDRYSDLDLDVVVADGVPIEPVRELERLCASFASIGERAALIVPAGPDRGDVVLASLLELSVRYHLLGATSPNILESLRVLAGRLDNATIQAAGEANRRTEDEPLTQLLDEYVRYAVGVEVALRRGRLWGAIEQLHRMRDLLMAIFARARGGGRPLQTFEADADETLQARLGATLPQYDGPSVRAALTAMLDLVEHNLSSLSAGRLQLVDTQREVIRAVRGRQAELVARAGIQ